MFSKEAIDNQVASGRVRFGFLDTSRKPNLEKAIHTALECFEDGIVVLFLDGMKYEDLYQEIKLHEGSEVTFVRMTLLAGRKW